MRVNHPDGKTAFFFQESTIIIGELDYAGKRYNGPRWVSIGHIGSDHGLLIGPSEWEGFVSMINEIDEAIKTINNNCDIQTEN